MISDCHVRTKRCTQCERDLPFPESFFRKSKAPSGYDWRCKDCNKGRPITELGDLVALEADEREEQIQAAEQREIDRWVDRAYALWRAGMHWRGAWHCANVAEEEDLEARASSPGSSLSPAQGSLEEPALTSERSANRRVGAASSHASAGGNSGDRPLTSETRPPRVRGGIRALPDREQVSTIPIALETSGGGVRATMRCPLPLRAPGESGALPRDPEEIARLTRRLVEAGKLQGGKR